MTYIKKNVFQFETDYEIPIKNQVWIIEDKIPDDNCKISTLRDCKTFYLMITDVLDIEQGEKIIEIDEELTELITPITHLETALIECPKCRFLNPHTTHSFCILCHYIMN